jgi:multisubunit Na+/H+ antiporter MnhG subunit
MFALKWFYQLHLYIIFCGIICIMSAIYIIKFKKGMKSRIKMHKLLNTVGVSLILLGVFIMFVGKQTDGLSHLTVPHAFGGIFAILLMISALVLARVGLAGNKVALNTHRWVGRVTGVIILLVAIVGLTVFISYI